MNLGNTFMTIESPKFLAAIFRPKSFSAKNFHVKFNGALSILVQCFLDELFSRGKHISAERIFRPKTWKWDCLQETANSLHLTSSLEVADSYKYLEFGLGIDTNIFKIESTFIGYNLFSFSLFSSNFIKKSLHNIFRRDYDSVKWKIHISKNTQWKIMENWYS